MHEAHGLPLRSARPAQQLLWVLGQPRRRRYRAGAIHAEHSKLHLSSLEQNRDYQRLLARLIKLSETFQQSLTPEQRRTWLMLEDALLDHAWFLHAYYFKGGYDLGKTTTRRPAPANRPPGSVNQFREQAVLLSALAKLLERLGDVGPPR